MTTVNTTDLTSVTATQLVTTLLGSGVTATNITFTGANVAGGTFTGGIAAGIGIDSGIILSTGNIAFAQGPNNTGSRTGNNSRPGDTDLDTIVDPLSTEDAAVLEFDFIPSTSTISFSYVFASEEYPEFVNSSFNDVFAFFLNGQNIALIPGTSTPVSINTVNAGSSSTPGTGPNSSFFTPNYGTAFDLQFDGFTTVLSATATGLVPGVTNRIKLAIADTADSSLDSAVFLQAASFGNATSVRVTATDSDAGEGTTPNVGVFTITRTGSTANALSVNYTISGTASATDYNTIPSTIVIPAGQASTTVTITPTDDALTEGNETVILSLTDTNNYDLGTPNSATVIVADNEQQDNVVNLSVSPASVFENGTTNLVYTFTREGATTSPLTVNYSVGGAATFNSDYTQTGAGSFNATTGTITFATGASTATLTIDPTADTDIENNETVALTLAAGTGYSIGTATAVTGTILDDDAPVITLTLNPTSVLEDGATNLVYTFTRTGNTATALTVNYGVAGTATLNTDYVQTGAATFTNTAGSITFASGASTATLTINPTTDTTVESNETIALTLAPNADYAIGTAGAVTGTIVDDDSQVLSVITIAATDVSAAETATGEIANPGVFTLTRTGSTTSALIVNYTTAGTASNGTDYTNLPATVTFAAGSATATVTVDPIDDTNVEGTETAVLNLATGTGYTLGAATSATVNIADNDFPLVTIINLSDNQTIVEGLTSPQNVAYTVTLSNASNQIITVQYATSDGTAIADSDYSNTTGTLTFNPGVTTQVINIPILNDSINEANETFTLTLTSPTNASLGTKTSTTTTITDTLVDSVTTTLPTNVENLSLEGTTAINGTGNAGNNVLIGNQANNILFGESGADTLKGKAGDDTLTGEADADIFEFGGQALAVNPETGFLEETGATLGFTGLKNTYIGKDTITDFATGVDQIWLDISTFTSIGPAGLDLSLIANGFTLVNQATNAGIDTQNAYLVYNQGTGDLFYNVNLSAFGNGGGGIFANLGVGTVLAATDISLIGDNELSLIPVITVTATDANAAETATGVTANPGVFTLARTGSLANALTVNYTTTGTATNGTDYSNLTETVTFAAGSATATVTVDPIDDTIVEGTETAILDLATGTGYTLGTATSATVNIADNDLPLVTINLSDNQTIVEGSTSSQNVSYTVTLSDTSTQTITVQYATSDGTAIAGSDYSNTTGTLTFNPGVTSRVINIPIVNNFLNEANETFTLTLTSPTNASLGTKTSATTTITDTLTASVTTTLPAFVENLSLTGTTSINGTGNAGNNVLIGNQSNNILFGGTGADTLKGKAGADTLTGGVGADIFEFGGQALAVNPVTGSLEETGATLGLTGPTSTYIRKDRITDFATGVDQILLDISTFTSVGPAGLDLSLVANGFTLVNQATNAGIDTQNAYLVYNQGTGDLFYNVNLSAFGNGGGGIFANLGVGTVLAATDISLIA